MSEPFEGRFIIDDGFVLVSPFEEQLASFQGDLGLFDIGDGATLGIIEPLTAAIVFALQHQHVAHHHLEQLRELGLVEKLERGGHYVLVGEV